MDNIQCYSGKLQSEDYYKLLAHSIDLVMQSCDSSVNPCSSGANVPMSILIYLHSELMSLCLKSQADGVWCAVKLLVNLCRFCNLPLSHQPHVAVRNFH